jgi:hypothetical protein
MTLHARMADFEPTVRRRSTPAELAALTGVKFDPRERRDRHGRWTDGGGGGSTDTPEASLGPVGAGIPAERAAEARHIIEKNRAAVMSGDDRAAIEVGQAVAKVRAAMWLDSERRKVALKGQIDKAREDFDEAWARQTTGADEARQRRKDYRAASVRKRKLRADLALVEAETTRDALAAVRPGFGEGKVTGPFRGAVREQLTAALRYYPKEWAAYGQRTSGPKFAFRNLRIRLVPRGRGWYKDQAYLSGHGEDISLIQVRRGDVGNLIHEFGHRVQSTWRDARVAGAEQEVSDPTDPINTAIRSFYERRTQGERTKWLGAGYRRNEVTRADKFFNPYVGKDYWHNDPREAFTMGMEGVFSVGSHQNAYVKDPEHMQLMLGLLATV